MSVHPDAGREHFTRNTESIRCWCYTCNDMTEHAVSNAHIGRCNNDHTTKKDPRKADIPRSTTDEIYTDEIYELHGVETSSPAAKQAVDLARFLQALDGPNQRHDGKGGLPAPRPQKQPFRAGGRKEKKT
jgi:hypothetical protein